MGRAATASKSFELYMEGSKWLVVTAAAALAFGFDGLKEHTKGNSFFVFMASALLLAASIAFGLFYQWHSYSYASKREAGQAPTEPDVQKAKRKCDWLFKWLLWSFGIGMLGFTGFTVVLLLELRAEKPDITLTAMGLPGGLLAVAEHQGKFWALDKTPSGYRWSDLPPLKPKD